MILSFTLTCSIFYSPSLGCGSFTLFSLPISLSLQYLVGIKVCQELFANTTFKSPPSEGCSLCAWHILKSLADPSSLRPTYKYSVLDTKALEQLWPKHTPFPGICPKTAQCWLQWLTELVIRVRQPLWGPLLSWSLESEPEAHRRHRTRGQAS